MASAGAPQGKRAKTMPVAPPPAVSVSVTRELTEATADAVVLVSSFAGPSGMAALDDAVRTARATDVAATDAVNVVSYAETGRGRFQRERRKGIIDCDMKKWRESPLPSGREVLLCIWLRFCCTLALLRAV